MSVFFIAVIVRFLLVQSVAKIRIIGKKGFGSCITNCYKCHIFVENNAFFHLKRAMNKKNFVYLQKILNN